jgi:flagellar hook-associated protein 3 FlgL
MITNLDAASERFVAEMNRTERTLATASRQVSSGKRISVASDGPDELAPLLQLRAAQSHNQQIQSSLGFAKTITDSADQALNASNQLMDRALTLASQGASDTMDAAGRLSLAQEVQSLQQQMADNSRTTVQGRYIFSGDNDASPPYQYDATAENGVDQLLTDPATRRVEDPAGGSFASSKTAADIFDSRNSDGTAAQDNVFAALNNLQLALTNNDTTAITDAIGSIKAASYRLNAMDAFYGTVQNRIQDATTFASNYDTELQTEISQKEDADVTAAALQATQANTQLQAAFQMQAKMPRTSLFDYLG